MYVNECLIRMCSCTILVLQSVIIILVVDFTFHNFQKNNLAVFLD